LDTAHVVRHHEIRASKSCPGFFMSSTEKLLSRVQTGVHEVPAAVTNVRTLTNVNLRVQPTTNADILRVIPAFTDLSVVGFVLGELVGANAFWYRDSGGFLWAGGTDVPSPRPA